MVSLDVGKHTVGKIIMAMIPPPQKRRTEPNLDGVLGVTLKVTTSSLTVEIPVQFPNRRQKKGH